LRGGPAATRGPSGLDAVSKTSANRSYCPAHLRQTTVGEADLPDHRSLLGYNFRTRNFI
jgi:hypothetical protein